MKPSPGDLIRITHNVWENLAAGSYSACYILKGCIAKIVSWEEYCDYLRKFEINTDFDDLKRFMERSGKLFNAILLTDASAGIKEEGADFTYMGKKGAAVLLEENDFEIVDPNQVSSILASFT